MMRGYTMRTKKCPVCSNTVIEIKIDYKSKKQDINTKEKIVVENVGVYRCENKECLHTWLPSKEEERIRSVIKKRTKHLITPKQIKMVREALPDMTKMEAANFFNMNSKAFIKWEKGYTEPNAAYDLLLRLAAYSKDNVKFIKSLHEKNFAFEPEDYELVCEKLGIEWKPTRSFNVVDKFPENTEDTSETEYGDSISFNDPFLKPKQENAKAA